MRSMVRNVLTACAEYGLTVEINANPLTAHLDWRGSGSACLMSINPDAHSNRELACRIGGADGPQRGRVEGAGRELLEQGCVRRLSGNMVFPQTWQRRPEPPKTFSRAREG
jgi:hypothetical protein